MGARRSAEGNPEDLRRFAQGHRLAQQRERELLRGRPPDPAEALERGLRWCSVAEALRQEAGLDEANESLEFHLRWARLRVALSSV